MTVKKFLIIFGCVMAVVLAIALSVPQQEQDNTMTFYYARSQFAYGVPDGVIGSEQRDVGGHERDVDYLLALYLEGPLDTSLTSPFPRKTVTRILSVTQQTGLLNIQLSDLSNAMTDSQFSLACACLTKTSLALPGVHAVQITSGNRSVRMNHANVHFYDESSSVKIPQTEEEK